MIYLVVGPSGSGKTKWLIEQANEKAEEGVERIVFVDSDDDQIYSLDHGVRLIDASVFHVDNADKLIGFISGILARDYDVETIYIDGIYNLIDLDDDNIQDISDGLNQVTKEFDTDIYLGLDWKKENVPESLSTQIHELTL